MLRVHNCVLVSRMLGVRGNGDAISYIWCRLFPCLCLLSSQTLRLNNKWHYQPASHVTVCTICFVCVWVFGQPFWYEFLSSKQTKQFLSNLDNTEHCTKLDNVFLSFLFRKIRQFCLWGFLSCNAWAPVHKIEKVFFFFKPCKIILYLAWSMTYFHITMNPIQRLPQFLYTFFFSCHQVNYFSFKAGTYQ